MDIRDKFRGLAEGLDDAQLAALAEETASVVESRRHKVALEDITAERLRDPQFALQVRQEIEAALKR